METKTEITLKFKMVPTTPGQISYEVFLGDIYVGRIHSRAVVGFAAVKITSENVLVEKSFGLLADAKAFFEKDL